MAHDLVLSTDLAGVKRVEAGGPRDVYALDHERLIIHLDRVGAGGVALPTGIPRVGQIIAQLAAFWFHETHNAAPSHFITDEIEAIHRRLTALAAETDTDPLEGRAHLVNRTRSLPVVADVIGALCGSDWEEYRATGTVAGHALPAGLAEGDVLPEPLYVPRALADAASDAGPTLEPGHVRRIETASRALLRTAASSARESAGLMLARARFEFGLFDGTVVLVGCPLTPETASFRELRADGAGALGPDVARAALDDHLERVHWQPGANLPELPGEVVAATAAGYRELFERLTGQEFS